MGDGLIYVMAVNIVIWIGIVFYLFNLDRKIKQLDQEIKNQSH